LNVRYRAMEPGDVAECVELLADHPVLGPRYGSLLEHLPALFLRFLDWGAGAVFFTEAGTRAGISMFGISTVLHDEFVEEMKTPPHFWIGPELTRRFVKGERPWLTVKEMEERSKRDGLSLLVWDNCARRGRESHTELHLAVMDAFIQIHRGYYWKELIANQPESRERAEFLLSTGAGVWDPSAGEYATKVTNDPTELVSRPHVFGITRGDYERGAWSGRWASLLFDYQAPRLGFTSAEKRLLCSALSGSTDEELARMLGVALPTIKKTWLSIYGRVDDHIPDLVGPERSGLTDGRRGREKRRGVLAYLRNHPEELRPVSVESGKSARAH
jgi:DNA-binding CsgD family transcriptional regulator